MPAQHSPGYKAAYQADVRAADRWLRHKYRKQWQAHFDQLRAARAARPDEYAAAWGRRRNSTA